MNSKEITVEVTVEDPQGDISDPGISNTLYIVSDNSNLIGDVYIDKKTGIRMRGPVYFEPFILPNEVPENCPLQQSKEITGIKFLGKSITYSGADTWYPSWARDGYLYSPWTDGKLQNDFCQSGWADSVDAHTGQAKIIGKDPLNLIIESLRYFQ